MIYDFTKYYQFEFPFFCLNCNHTKIHKLNTGWMYDEIYCNNCWEMTITLYKPNKTIKEKLWNVIDKPIYYITCIHIHNLYINQFIENEISIKKIEYIGSQYYEEKIAKFNTNIVDKDILRDIEKIQLLSQ